MKHKIETVNKIGEALEALPKINISKTEVTTKEAIRLIHNNIHLLVQKGYSIEMIVDVLAEHGLNIKAKTLIHYLADISKNGPVDDVERKSSIQQQRNLNSQNISSGAGKRGDPMIATNPTAQSKVGYAGFTPRPDTKNI